MNKITAIVIALASFLIGLVATALLINVSAPYALIKEVKSPYDYEKTVRIISDRISHKQGWVLQNVIDQRQAILNGGGNDVGKVAIIKYCNGVFAGRMLNDDERKKIAVMMPISIAVYEKSTGEVYVSVSNGYLTSKLFGGQMEAIIEEVSKEVEEVLDFLNFKYNVF